MNSAMISFLVPAIALLVLFALPIYSVSSLVQLSNHADCSTRKLVPHAVNGFIVPVAMLLIWEFWLHQVV
jgi:hypothetical protein